MKTSLIDMFACLFAPSTLTMDHSSNLHLTRSHQKHESWKRGRPGKPGAKLTRRAAAHTLTHRS